VSVSLGTKLSWLKSAKSNALRSGQAFQVVLLTNWTNPVTVPLLDWLLEVTVASAVKPSVGKDGRASGAAASVPAARDSSTRAAPLVGKDNILLVVVRCKKGVVVVLEEVV
jgi:hypothetical protein